MELPLRHVPNVPHCPAFCSKFLPKGNIVRCEVAFHGAAARNHVAQKLALKDDLILLLASESNVFPSPDKQEPRSSCHLPEHVAA